MMQSMASVRTPTRQRRLNESWRKLNAMLLRLGSVSKSRCSQLRDAEKKLADLRKDPTASAQEIRLAEIDLAKAKLAVADATDSEFDATNKLKDAQLILNEAVDGAIVGSDTYNKLLEDVFDAKEKEREASERLTDAVDRETEAYERLAEAIKTASDAAKNTGRTGSESSQRMPTVPTTNFNNGAIRYSWWYRREHHHQHRYRHERYRGWSADCATVAAVHGG
jgi:methyl-accepting chemotaxis protein